MNMSNNVEDTNQEVLDEEFDPNLGDMEDEDVAVDSQPPTPAPLDPGNAAHSASGLGGAPAPHAPRSPAGITTTANIDRVAAPRKSVENDSVRDASVGGLGLTPEAAATKAKLDAQPKVAVMIPLDPGEKIGAYRSVSINGYRFEIKKNVMVKVPMAVAQIIMEAYNIENTIQQYHPLNLANKSEDERKRLDA